MKQKKTFFFKIIIIDEYTFFKHIMISLNFVCLDQMITQSHYTKLIVMANPKNIWIFQHLMLFEIRMLIIYQYFNYIGKLWSIDFFSDFFSFYKIYFQKRISYYKNKSLKNKSHKND